LRKLGKYEVFGELGHGAMGVVYRARDPIINRLVALKTITTGLADDPNLLQRFYREAQSAGGLQHPNIVTIYDMGDENNVPYIAMELIDGDSLEKVISQRMSVPLALKFTYLVQACRAFDYAHKRGIVHRDIKPGNVMVNKESVAKVVDFGIARVLDTSKTQTGMLIGTFAYMSPEQYHGEHADERSDIWSFGVLLYELLCYQRPFVGDNPATLMHSICSAEPPPLRERVPDCPAEMDAILSRILRKSPQDRFQSMEDLLLELEPVYKQLQARSVVELIDQSQGLIVKGEFAQAREFLRETLKVDSANPKARNLLEKVNAELKRLLIRPQAQQRVDKSRILLGEGKIQEARAEVDSALQLDSNFEDALELKEQIQQELDRAQVIAEWIEASRLRLAEGMPDEAEELLAKVFELEPSNKEANTLRRQALDEKAERKKRLHLLKKMQEARTLWTQLNYEDSIALLIELHKEFPGEEEVQRLLDTVREDNAEQQRQKGLEAARNLLAVGNCGDSRALLADLQEQFPNDEEIPRLLEDVRIEEAKQRRLHSMTEARKDITNGQYDKAIAMLESIEKDVQGDQEIARLLEWARRDRTELRRQKGVAEVRRLLAARLWDECEQQLAGLKKEFSGDEETVELHSALLRYKAEEHKLEILARARDLLSNREYGDSIQLLVNLGEQFPGDEATAQLLRRVRSEELEQRRQHGITEARNLLAARRYAECTALLTQLEKQFPGDQELGELKETVREEEREKRRQEAIGEVRKLQDARRYEDCNAQLAGLRTEFPDDETLAQLQREILQDQEEQRKLATLEKARALLDAKKYQDAIRLVEILPNDEEVARFLATARSEEVEYQRQQGMTEARSLLAARRFDECGALLIKLQQRFPEDSELTAIQEGLRRDRAEQEKLAALHKARNLLAKQNYDGCITLLTELNVKFSADDEILRLLGTARDGLAERQKVKQLAEARNLLATQRFSEALHLLDGLRAKHPKDAAIQKLRGLIESEQEKQRRAERLQAELEGLKKLVSEKKYAEVLALADPLQKEFPGNGDLLRLIEFARSQQSQIASDKRLKAVIDEVKKHTRANRFGDAVSSAEAGLKAFPENAELAYLRDQAAAEEKKQRTRGMIEQRIREIKFKINREHLSEAIDLAKETIALAGPEPELTQLLNSAVVELKAREKKRQGEEKLQEIRILKESGEVDHAAETLHDAVSTGVLDAFDPRVNRLSQKIDAAKNAPAPAASSDAASLPPDSFSNEYAFSQGGPPPTGPLIEDPGAADSAAPQASSASQTSISSQPVAPALTPRYEPIQPVEETPVPLPRPVVPAVLRRGEEKNEAREPAAHAEASPAGFKKPVALAAIAVGGILAVWTVVHFTASNKTAEKSILDVAPPSGVVHPGQAPATQPGPKPPPLNPIEVQQLDALSLSNKLVASGDWRGALQTLQRAEELNGPLNAEIKTRETSVNESMQNSALAKLRQQEAGLWQQATVQVEKGEFDAATRNLRRIVAMDTEGVRGVDARKYLDDVIPRRREEEALFRQGQEASKASDPQTLQKAAASLSQVIALDGPRKAEAEELEHSVEAKLTALKNDSISRQIGELGAGARQNIQQGDFKAARDKADQIRKLGGDSSALSRSIDQAQDLAAQQQKEAQPIPEYHSPLAAPAPEAPASAPVAPRAAADDEAKIQAVLQSFIGAFEQKDANAIRQLWPGIPTKTFAGYNNSFEGASSIRISVSGETVKISPDGMTATVSAQLEQQYSR